MTVGELQRVCAANTALVHQINALAGLAASIERHGYKNWRSETFRGSRHRVTLIFEGPQSLAHSDAFRSALPVHEFAIPDCRVCGARVMSGLEDFVGEHVTVMLTCELTVLEED